jgi:hypothetical protein
MADCGGGRGRKLAEFSAKGYINGLCRLRTFPYLHSLGLYPPRYIDMPSSLGILAAARTNSRTPYKKFLAAENPVEPTG